MNKINITLLIYAACLIFFAYFVYPVLSVLLIVWFGIFFTIKLKKSDEILSNPQKTTFTAVSILYPLCEFIIKYFIIADKLHVSWLSSLNRAEHFLFSAAITILIYPLLKPILKKINTTEAIILTIGIVAIIGNLNELFEYIIRNIYNLTDTLHFAAYYRDTIYDIATNIVGAFIGFLCIYPASSS